MLSGRRGVAGVLAAAGVGLACGLLNAVYAVTYVGLAFPGPLAVHGGTALSLGLLSSAVLGAVVALGLRYPGGMAVISPEATLVIGGVALSLAASVAPDRLLPTVLATVALVTLATGAALYAVGRARLGYLMHYLPYPVVAGLIGGLGVLLVIGGLDLAAPGLAAGAPAPHRHLWLEVGLTAALGTALWLLRHRYPSGAGLPVAVVLAVAAFWFTAWEVGDIAPWLPGPFAAGAAGQPGDAWAGLGRTDWAAIAAYAPTLAMLVAFLVVILLTDTASMEAALGEHLDADQTLRTFGLANAASGALGGFTGVMSLSSTVLAHRCRAPCQLVGATSALVSLSLYLAGPGPFSLVPAFVVGGLVVFVGLEFVGDWVVLMWRRLSGPDRAILAAVVAGVSLAGFAEGFLLGLLLGFVFFAVSYSRLPAIRAETTARYRFSHVDRPEADRQWLRAEGDGTLVLELGGFLFFGSAWRIYDRVRRRTLDRRLPPLRAVLLDFRHVSGVDSSGWHNFRKVAELGLQDGFDLVLSQLPGPLERAVRLEAVAGPRQPHVHLADDLDRGLEWAEGRTLGRRGLPPGLTEAASPVFDGGPVDPAALADGLAAFVERQEFAPGDALIRQGDASDDVYVVREGLITIAINGHDGGRIRLRRAGPGTVIGEIAFILRQPRTAWAVADTAVVADRISRAAVARMAAEEPQLLVALQASLLRILARRVSDSTELVVQLSR